MAQKARALKAVAGAMNPVGCTIASFKVPTATERAHDFLWRAHKACPRRGTTIEEKSMGAYAKSGASPIHGLIKPGDVPPHGGLFLLDMVPDGEPPQVGDESRPEKEVGHHNQPADHARP